MGVKNVNFFEQHVEKIVLGVAVAGAAFMGYLAMQPVAIVGDHDTEVTPQTVEQAITEELKKVNGAQKALDEKGKPAPPKADFVGGYKRMAQMQPLDSTLLAATPPFGPRNLPLVGGGIIDEGPSGMITVTPAPVPPDTNEILKNEKEKLLRAEAMQLQVSTDPPQVDATGTPVPLPAGMQLKTHNANVVVIDGYIPVGKMALEMLSIQDVKKRLTPDLQRGLVYRIEVTRKEQLPNGGWSEWKIVPPAKGSVPPVEISWAPDTDLVARLVEVDASFKQIMLPDFYRDALGQPIAPPILTRPLPPSIDTENQKLDQAVQAAKANAVVGGFKPITPVIGGMQPTGTAPVATMLPSVDQIKSMQVQPFTFWDETVLPDHKYQYQVEVKLVNPTFSWKYGLANAKMKDVPLLTTGPVLIPGIIVVHSDLAFFIQGFGGMSGQGVNGKIFKQENGRWYSTTFTTPIGVSISGPLNTGGPIVDVDTNFAVVDCQQNGGSWHVILRDPTGNLVTRETPEDWNKTERVDLEKKVTDGRAAAAATAPADMTTLTPTGPVPTLTPPSGPPLRAPVINPPGGVAPPSGPPLRAPVINPPTVPTTTPPTPGRTPTLVNPPRRGPTTAP